jgi:hypothetical protein
MSGLQFNSSARSERTKILLEHFFSENSECEPITNLKPNNMKVINSKAHGVLDYLVGIFLIASPWILNFANGGAAQNVPVVLGVMTIIMSLCTDYELGAVKKIPLALHLNIDLLSGIVLAASPWLFGFRDEVYMPHLVLGLLEIGAVLLSERKAYHHHAEH